MGLRPRAAAELLYYIGMHVVRTDGRSLGRLGYGHVITKFSRVGRLPHFLSYAASPTRGGGAPLLLSIYLIRLSYDM